MAGRIVKVVYDFEHREISVTMRCEFCRTRTRARNAFPGDEATEGAVQLQCAKCGETAAASLLPHPRDFQLSRLDRR